MKKDGEIHDMTMDPDRELKTRVVKDLLEEYGREIEELRDMVADVLPADWDELWLLRYILSSHHSAKEAAPKIRRAVEYRREHAQLESAREAARHDPPLPHELDKELLKVVVMGSHEGAKDNSHLIFFRPGVSCFPEASRHFGYEALKEWSNWYNERNYHILDRRTRESGYLTKAIIINDLKNASLFGRNRITDRTFNRAMGDSSKLSEILYPQMLERAVVINPPKFLRYLYKFGRFFLPESTIRRYQLCRGFLGHNLKTTYAEGGFDARRCPFCTQRFDVEKLPSYIGGSCTCVDKGGCIGGHGNDDWTYATDVAR
mmetsp:Transcript_1109/g.3444  ORF Transcript_1109/g.3444 Transcript_1109/m.3444 type:complete len:317 (-) Transcript_1109:1478-2428(-)|eukprot:CAMPEP_0198729018 /NCGR_PEP_ID=MMETSP1475-20131203/13593_1 /TAXON_ID= ORGANISM="Unidentified sp., Strain CCMP1999" /NCGR_SAMPLE_ID=MMETSP1475 /ASSEMBLY_ACC=CAM_ASM_001111 /LENGTH=316 /DNA_ID=CAMNT_0044491545 /DNA_START=219 /DNA_END=1169 /DNA_ORIENTATION=+